MVSTILVNLIRTNISTLSDQWATDVSGSDQMKKYRYQSVQELRKRNRRFFENLVKWIEEGAQHSEIKTYFARVGRERYHEGIPLAEINYGIIMAKRILWEFILAQGVFSNAAQVYQALELITVISNFFDFGLFYIGVEYTEELCKKLADLAERKKIDPNELYPCYVGPSDKQLEKMFGIKFNIKK